MTNEPGTVARDIVAALQQAHMNEDVDTYGGLFDIDASWITSRGVLVTGREALVRYLASVMPGGLGDGTVVYDLAGHRLVTDDVIVVVVEQRYLMADGAVKSPGGRHLHTYVIRNDAMPVIVAGQNTTVVSADG